MNKKSIEKFEPLKEGDFVELYFHDGFFRGTLHFDDDGALEVSTQAKSPADDYSFVVFKREDIKAVQDSVNTYAKAVIVLKK